MSVTARVLTKTTLRGSRAVLGLVLLCLTAGVGFAEDETDKSAPVPKATQDPPAPAVSIKSDKDLTKEFCSKEKNASNARCTGGS